jgi:predicted amidohydrolase
VIEDQWDALLKTTALLSHAYVIFVNRVGYEDGMGFWGGSRVIAPMGQTEHTFPLFEEQGAGIVLNHRLLKIGRYLAKYN